jgi:hypothetical protein
MIEDGLAKKSFKIFCGRLHLLVQAANVGLKIVKPNPYSLHKHTTIVIKHDLPP